MQSSKEHSKASFCPSKRGQMPWKYLDGRILSLKQGYGFTVNLGINVARQSALF